MPLGPKGILWVNQIMLEVSKAWTIWQTGLTWNGLVVNGSGIGAWAGFGSGGMLNGPPFQMSPIPFEANHPRQVEFTNALISILTKKFSDWPLTFSFSSVSYIGGSGATPLSPGPVSASSVPGPIGTLGSGQNIEGIAKEWEGKLPKPDWQLDSPYARTKPLIQAIATTIEQAFAVEWLYTTIASGDLVVSGGAPGSGTIPPTPSSGAGKLV